ncbi:hypothetical protein RRG08_038250 [Elysia crispata]|uniref:Uncharacterized protein n=1 Tax=Elysia crispata TaxID=231223 RepID=A0AAE1AN29_9GAST|nr:hypothetical protein RRG08_038250 [Elysia crispata]
MLARGRGVLHRDQPLSEAQLNDKSAGDKKRCSTHRMEQVLNVTSPGLPLSQVPSARLQVKPRRRLATKDIVFQASMVFRAANSISEERPPGAEL